MFDYFKDVIVKTADDLKNSRSPYSENSQLIKIDVNSPSLPSKDAELFYCHVARLLFVRKRTRPNIPACVISLFTRVKSPMGYCKDLHLNIDLLFLNKIPILLMISRYIRFMHFKALLSKHNKCVQNRLQQIVQSRGFKTICTFVDRAFENIVDWVSSNLHLDLTNCTVDLHVFIHVIQVVNDMGKQEVTPDGI